MSDRLQRHFEEVSGQQENLKLLHSQWQFDKKLIPKALQTIGGLFPHYSRHDQSHSDQILVNIERLLGDDRITLLSATDSWLLLEAAYWHDIGMVVPQKALQEAFQDPAFESYRQQVANSAGHELQKFAQHFCTEVTKAFLGADTPLDAMEKFRVFMAEWFRRKHHTRSESAINNPWQELGLSSPRTELIPKRLFRLLGQVCGLHGRSFEDVLSQLPFKEVGMANDDCHPRFVACLLRLGDLLDIDDNRFCPVMQCIAGEGRPALSKAHEDKHTSIRHFRLDPERIEITAVCDSVDGYVEQWRWLDGLRTEVQKQMSHWQDIAPQRSLGLLPTIGELMVDIAGRKLITKPGARTEFQLNAERALKLLQGENLYKRTDTIRELLQNAVDATLLRLWQTEKSKFVNQEIQPGDFSNPSFKRYPIHARLQRSTKPASAPEKIKWTLSIIDQGVGMSLDDLNFLMNVAGSGNNTKRQNVIQSMPEWLRPSGNFGIGLQSVFMWTEKVHLRTKSLQTNEVLDVILHNPSGRQRGLVEIERVDGNPIECNVGTQLMFELETAAVFRKSFDMKDEFSFQAILDQYDPLLNNELPLEAMELINAARLFSENSPIDVQWEYRNLEFLYSSNANSSQEEEEEEEEEWEFFSETNSRFQAELVSTSETHLLNGDRVFYRGQLVEKWRAPGYYFFNYQLDIYANTASDWLTFDRNSWSTKGKAEIGKVVNHNIKLWVERNKKHLLLSHKAELAALAKLRAKINGDGYHLFWQSLENELSSDWKKLSCRIQQDRQSTSTDCYQNILQSGWALINSRSFDQRMNFESKLSKLAFVNEVEMGFCVDAWCGDPNHGIRYSLESNASATSFPRHRHLLELIEINQGEDRLQISPSSNLRQFIEQTLNDLHGYGRRLMLPMAMLSGVVGIEKLKFREDISIGGGRLIFPHVPVPTLHVLLPHEITFSLQHKLSIRLNHLDEFFVWVHKNLAIPIPLGEVKDIYKMLMTYIDDELMKDSAVWKKHRSEG